ncbi:MAG: hypothetical protein HQL53_02115 [Magnetococcales bacterium]|nr:hypothetical protein [Magnetococcales bacterium]
MTPVETLLREGRKKNLIFCITSGRSGSKLLTELLRVFPTMSSHHEPDPNFSLVIRSVLVNPEMTTNFWVNHKLPAILEHQQPHYVETSHLAGKGFISALLHLNIVPTLVMLRRPPRDVAKSLYGYAAIPGRSIDGLMHLLSPADLGVMPLPHWTSLHDYQICFWYCLEMERRQRVYAQWVERLGKASHEIHMKDLLDYHKFYDFSKRLGVVEGVSEVDIQAHHARICSQNQNPREKFQPIDFDVEQMEQEVLQLIANYEPLLWHDVQAWYQNHHAS